MFIWCIICFLCMSFRGLCTSSVLSVSILCVYDLTYLEQYQTYVCASNNASCLITLVSESWHLLRHLENHLECSTRVLIARLVRWSSNSWLEAFEQYQKCNRIGVYLMSHSIGSAHSPDYEDNSGDDPSSVWASVVALYQSNSDIAISIFMSKSRGASFLYESS